MKVRFPPLALRELNDAFPWYSCQAPVSAGLCR